MKLLLDESCDARLAAFLRAIGHDVTRVAGDYPAGISDSDVLARAWNEQRILVTDDRDFGELVFRRREPHQGVIFLRLGGDARLETKKERLAHVLTEYADVLSQFLVVTQRRVRVRSTES